MRSVGEGFELILVAILAGIATDVIHGAVCCWFGLAVLTADFRFWEELLSASHRIAAASAPQTSRGLMILFALNPRPLLYAIEDQPIRIKNLNQPHLA